MIDNVFSKPLTRVFSLELAPGASETYENTGLSLSGIVLSLRYGAASVIENGMMLPDASVAVTFSERDEASGSARVKIIERRGLDGSPIFDIKNLTQERLSLQVFLVLSPQTVTPAFVERAINSSLDAFRKKEIAPVLKRLESAESGISHFDKDLSVKTLVVKKPKWSVSRITGLNEAEINLDLGMDRLVVAIMGINYMAGISPWFMMPFSVFAANTAADVQTFPKWRDKYLVEISMVRNNKATLQMTNADIPPEELFFVIIHVPVKSDRWDFSEWDRTI